MPIRALLSFALVWIAVATPCAPRDTIEVPDGATIVAVTPDGLRTAFALPSPENRNERTVVHWSGEAPDGCRSVELPGIVRDLTYVTAESVLFALQHKPGKNSRGETHLTRIDMGTCRFKRELLMPESASGLTHWPRESSLLVASRDEVRTVRLPALRSGPLFRIPGPNRKIEVLGGSRVLVGQTESVILIDLSDPPTRESMPIRSSWIMPSPIVSIDAWGNGQVWVATEADWPIFEPLSEFEPGQIGIPLVTVTPKPLTPQPDEPAPATEVRVDKIVKRESPVPIERMEPVEQIAAATPPTPIPEPTAAKHQVFGRIQGSVADSVVAVVLSGPNNLLREAARLPLDDGGNWFVDGLAPGPYRIQLDGGGGRVVVSDPPFLILEVQGEAGIEAPSIRAVRIL